MSTDSRASMVRSAASLIRSRGVSAKSLTDVLSDSGAPRGSIYHHFPDGKRQLAEDAISWTSARVLAHLRAGKPTSPSAVLERFIAIWRQVVVTSGATAGCVVAGVAIDTGPEETALMEVVRATFRSWATVLAEELEVVGVPSARARPIALATIAAMEGALILGGAEETVKPLDAVAEELMRLLPSKSSTRRKRPVHSS